MVRLGEIKTAWRIRREWHIACGVVHLAPADARVVAARGERHCLARLRAAWRAERACGERPARSERQWKKKVSHLFSLGTKFFRGAKLSSNSGRLRLSRS
jgi:hypothetical protein